MINETRIDATHFRTYSGHSNGLIRTTVYENIHWNSTSSQADWMFGSSSSLRELWMVGMRYRKVLWMHHPSIRSNDGWTSTTKTWTTKKCCFLCPSTSQVQVHVQSSRSENIQKRTSKDYIYFSGRLAGLSISKRYPGGANVRLSRLLLD